MYNIFQRLAKCTSMKEQNKIWNEEEGGIVWNMSDTDDEIITIDDDDTENEIIVID